MGFRSLVNELSSFAVARQRRLSIVVLLLNHSDFVDAIDCEDRFQKSFFSCDWSVDLFTYLSGESSDSICFRLLVDCVHVCVFQKLLKASF